MDIIYIERENTRITYHFFLGRRCPLGSQAIHIRLCLGLREDKTLLNKQIHTFIEHITSHHITVSEWSHLVGVADLKQVHLRHGYGVYIANIAHELGR